MFVRSASVIRLHTNENISCTICKYSNSINTGCSNVSVGENTYLIQDRKI